MLASTKLKIEGADIHIKDVAAGIKAFLETEPYPVRSFIDVEGDPWIVFDVMNGQHATA